MADMNVQTKHMIIIDSGFWQIFDKNRGKIAVPAPPANRKTL